MAARTLYPSQDATQNWSAASWSLADDNAKNQAKPAVGENDVVIFTANSTAAMAVDEATSALGSLTMTGYTGTLTINSATTDIDVNGAVTLDGTIALGAATGDIYCSGNFIKTTAMTALPSGLTVTLDGTGTLTCNSVSGGTLVNNTAGTITVADAQLWSSWTNTLGTYTADAYAHTIVGNIVYTNGTCTTTGTWTQTGTGALKWTDLTNGEYPANLQANGTGTITNTYFATKAVSGNGTINGVGTGYIYLLFSSGNYWTFTGTCSCPVVLNATAAVTTNADIILEGKDFTCYRANNILGAVFGGNVNLKGAAATAGDLLLSAPTGAITTFDMASYSLTANNITMGHATNAVTLDLGTGTHYITGAVTRGAGTPALNFGSSKIKLGVGGSINGSNITATSDAAIVNPPASVVGGTVSNVIYEAGKTLDCSGGYTKDGGGNTTGEFWFGSRAERGHPSAIRNREWGFAAGTRR